ncbi:hypothetical protein KMP13_17660 [Epibacterium ulvae]|nr:hypothetical protein [Epibacterium ulvae]MBT8155657.1 hypothetical protein [Epibacterium ulvae]
MRKALPESLMPFGIRVQVAEGAETQDDAAAQLARQGYQSRKLPDDTR